LLAPRPTPKVKDQPSSAVRGCLFNLFIATLYIEGRFSIRNLRTRHVVVTGTHIHGKFFLTMRNALEKGKIKTFFLWSMNFLRKSCRLSDNTEKLRHSNKKIIKQGAENMKL
jgi:hypothetical protein